MSEETMNSDRETIDVLVVDNDAKLHAKLIQKQVNRVQKYPIVVSGYTQQSDLINNMRKDGSPVVLLGIVGNGSQAEFDKMNCECVYDKWARFTPQEMIQSIKEVNPNTKIVIFTGGSSYSPQDAERDGADGYLCKVADHSTEKPMREILTDTILKAVGK